MRGELKAQRHEEALALARLIQGGGQLADLLVVLCESECATLSARSLIRREVRRYQAAVKRYAAASQARTIAAARSREAAYNRKRPRRSQCVSDQR